MLLYNNSECPCEKLLWRNKNASCSENLRLDCLHFIEKMNLIFNSSTCYLTDFRFSDKNPTFSSDQLYMQHLMVKYLP